MRWPKINLGLLWVAFAFFLQACGVDELKKVEAISNKKINVNKERTLGADLIYSDSAIVKAKGYAPVLDKVSEADGRSYQEMPNGVQINFYENQALKGSIKSDYAIRRESEKLTIFKKNVVVVFPNGKYETEELTWDEDKKVYRSPSGKFTKSDGSIAEVSNFVSSEDFNNITMQETSAKIYTEGTKL